MNPQVLGGRGIDIPRGKKNRKFSNFATTGLARFAVLSSVLAGTS